MAYKDYNPYSEIKAIFDAKVAYNNATTDEERKRQNEIANAARDKLKAYGYGDIEQQLSATGADATAARKILEQYAPKTTTTTDTNTKNSTNTLKTGIDNEAYNNRVASASTKNDIYFNTVQNDHTNVNNKYTDLYNYANSDITQTDEYKSAFNNIMPQYNLKAMQGRENELASGSSSNGGNIDSYAAANALRQQTAITAKGQALAHQMGLEAANSRVNNVNNILSNLGVYNSSVYSAMSDSINNDRNMFNDITNNEQTALNNETARLSEQASVTGYVPNEWTIKNDDIYNQFLNEDGTFKTEKENVDIQSLINSAKANGDTETAKKLAVVRARKMLGNYGEYGKYINEGDVAFMDNQHTEARRQFDAQDALARETLGAEVGMNSANNQNKIDQIKTEAQSQKDLLTHQKELTVGTDTKQLSEDAEKVAKQIQEKINKYSNEKYGVDVMEYKGRGTYGFTLPKGHVDGWWDDIVIKEILESPLTTDEKDILIEQLGFGELLADFNQKYKQDENGKVVNK